MKRFIFVAITSIALFTSWFFLTAGPRAEVTENQLEKVLPVRSGEATVQKGSDLLHNASIKSEYEEN